MKVLRLWHAAVVSEYRKKVRAIAAIPDVDLMLLIPPAWHEGGQRVRYTPDAGIDTGYGIRTGRIAHPDNIRRYWFVNGLVSVLRTFRPDIVDMEEEPFSAVVCQVMTWCRTLRIPAKFIFHTAHNIFEPISGKFGRYERKALACGHGAVARNDQAASRLRSIGFQGPIARIGNGIDLSCFIPQSGVENDPLPDLQGRRVIGYVGKLRSGKGVMDLIRAFRSLPSDTVLLLVGEGCLRKEIIQLPRHHPNLRGRIHLAGPVPHDRMPDYYRRMDVCVLPSRTETGWVESFGRVLIESMACGTPVIGSDSGAIPSTIGEAGLVYREGDYHALASRLLDLLVQPRLAEKLRDRGLNRCRVFSWSRIAKDHWRLYREVMP